MKNTKCLIISAFYKNFSNREISAQISCHKNAIEKYNINMFYINNKDILSDIILKSLGKELKINKRSCKMDEWTDINEVNEFLRRYNIDVLIVVGFSNNKALLFNSLFFDEKIKIIRICCRHMSGSYFFE